MSTTKNYVGFEELTPPHQDVVHRAIGIYVRWLNQYLDDDSHTDFRYSIEHFLDKNTNQWADLQVHVVRDEGPDYFNGFYAELIPHDGDDGGPATLYLYADNYGATEENDEYGLKFLLQEFDTMFSPVYRSDPDELFKN